jgi:molybdopterin molybdotransferase
MLSVEVALALVAQNVAPLAPRRLPLGEAAGLVLAEDIVSAVESPPYDKTMMDGYAVVASDREPLRRVLEEVGAGTVPRHAVTPGTATRIMTGAPIPEGADAVVQVEQTELIDEHTGRLLAVDPRPGHHILKRGASLRRGELVLSKGALMRPIEIAILAEIGHGVVAVQPRPRVSVLPTGNELVSVGETPAEGQIRNSNGPMLVAAAIRAGADAFEFDIARDDRDDLRRKIEQGLSADVLLLSGGVSAGDFDYVPGVLAELGVELVFHKIALRPGKPLWFGVKHDDTHRALVFGLPGNPVSSFVCFELFARPTIAALAGRGFTDPSIVTARLSHDYDHAGGRAACLPARVKDVALRGEERSVEILPWLGSADLAALARANGLVRLPAEKLRVAAGSAVDVLLV